MRILFVLKQLALLRHFDTVARALADRGHELCLATRSREKTPRLPPLVADHPRVSLARCPARRTGAWGEDVRLLRGARDYLRYLEPRYRASRKLRARAFRRLVKTFSSNGRRARRGWSDVALSLTDPERARLQRLFERIEEAIPSDPLFDAFLASHRPDMLLITPLVTLGASQTELVKSARALGIPTAVLVFSWDNLSNKGVMHVLPDRVLVWNEIQKREATELHGVPPADVVVTGAPRFDAFFGMRPTSDRSSYCRQLGLDPARPIITYLCSSPFVAPREVDFVQQWMSEVRRSDDPPLGQANLVVRPHPRHTDQWNGVQLTDWAPAALSPAGALNADQTLYDCLHHSGAVVGLNTSAQIEAAILGRPVFTLLAPDFVQGQQGTLHFAYLLRESGGIVSVAKTFDEHRHQLADALAGRWDPAHAERFVEAFVRPHGLGTPVTPIVVDAIEAWTRTERRRVSRGFLGGLRARYRAWQARMLSRA